MVDGGRLQDRILALLPKEPESYVSQMWQGSSSPQRGASVICVYHVHSRLLSGGLQLHKADIKVAGSA